MISKLLRRLPKYLTRFGLLHGLRLAWRIEKPLGRYSGQLSLIDVPGLASGVWLRDSVADNSIFWQCLVMEQYDLDRFPHVKRLDASYRAAVAAGRPPVIIDCGGNIGLSVRWFAQRFPEARVVVIEPDERNFDMLQRNLASYSERVVMVKGGVWPESGWLHIRNPEAGSAAFQVAPCVADTPGAFRAYGIDELQVLGGGGELLIVKLDIEGAQSALFSAHTEWVGRAHLISLELDDWLMPWQGTSRKFFACLSRYPFEYLLGGESIFCFRDESS